MIFILIFFADKFMTGNCGFLPPFKNINVFRRYKFHFFIPFFFFSFNYIRQFKMGLLSLGTPLHWNEAKEYADHVRKHGIAQFLNIYHSQKDKQNQSLLWGDEVIYYGLCVHV